MKEQPKVSIIVPAYNVGNYIKKCIGSLVSQTYKNIEIIIINDGSTDDTLNIIQSFSDNRIVVINQNNSGVSASRNKGIEASKGEYLVFVDGDDYLSDDYVDYFLNLSIKYDSDFVFSSKCFTTKHTKKKSIDVSEKMITNNEATALLLNPDIIVGCWNKMFRASFIKKNELKFDESLFYGEGLMFITKASTIANRIVTTNYRAYYYRRNNVNSATSIFNINKYINGEISLLKIYDSFVPKKTSVEIIWYLHMCFFYMGAISRICFFRKKKQYKNYYKKWRLFLKNNINKVIFNKKISVYRKAVLVFGTCFPHLLGFLDNKRRQKLSNNTID